MDLAQPEALDLLADLPANGAAVRVVVTGDSMRPFLRGGETVTLQRVNPAEIRCGDLALCQHAGGRLLLHRVVRIRRRDDGTVRIETQGDALRTPDEPVPESQVLGRGSEVARTRRSAELISLDTRWQRRRGLLVTLRQGTLWSSALARARLHMLGGLPGALAGLSKWPRSARPTGLHAGTAACAARPSPPAQRLYLWR
jgi:signal peptidase I